MPVIKVVVLGDVDSFRHIVVSALRAWGVEAAGATLGDQSVTCLTEEHPDVVILDPPEGVFEGAYLEQISQLTQGARVFVVRESRSVVASDDGAVSYVSRVQVQELVDTVRRITTAAPA
jgi:CheY-like chemotaxis protein